MPQQRKIFDGKWLSGKGLNLQAVMDLSSLPADLVGQLQQASKYFERYNQLVLVGHAGRELWQKIEPDRFKQKHPTNQYSLDMTTKYFQSRLKSDEFEIVFPLPQSEVADPSHHLGFQQFGKIAGWHHQSPLMIGINSSWGTWFAYRAVALVKANYIESKPVKSNSPCATCKQPPCIQACPAKALDSGKLELQTCLDYRTSVNSKCKDRCISRMACPVQIEKKYSLDQIKYHYSQSMGIIENRITQ